MFSLFDKRHVKHKVKLLLLLITLLIAGLLMLSPKSAGAVQGDIVFKRIGGDVKAFPPAIFSHWIHRIHYLCSVCHAPIFEMKKGSSKITMGKIRQGQFCGQCHNGRAAFNVDFQTCMLCHQSKKSNH